MFNATPTRTAYCSGMISVSTNVTDILTAWTLPGRRWLAALALGPLLVPPYVAAVAWVDLLGPAGWLARATGLATVQGPSAIAPGWVYSTPSAALLLGGCWFPLVGLAAWAALRRLPSSALEAARLAEILAKGD